MKLGGKISNLSNIRKSIGKKGAKNPNSYIEKDDDKNEICMNVIEDSLCSESSKIYHINKKYMLYKTEICRSHSETGFCKYGNKCQFAHSLTELRNVNRHPRYKTETCKTFWEEGSCPYGTRCCFIHVKNEFKENHELISKLITDETQSDEKFCDTSVEILNLIKRPQTNFNLYKCSNINNNYEENIEEKNDNLIKYDYSSDLFLEFNDKNTKYKFLNQNLKTPTINFINDYIENNEYEELDDDDIQVQNISITSIKNCKQKTCSNKNLFKKNKHKNMLTEEEIFLKTMFIYDPYPFKKTNDAYKWTKKPLFYVNFNRLK